MLFRSEGIDTNVDYQYEILSRPDYLSGDIDIEFIAENEEALREALREEAD